MFPLILGRGRGEGERKIKNKKKENMREALSRMNCKRMISEKRPHIFVSLGI